MADEFLDDDDGKIRFLVSVTKEDLTDIDKARKREGLSRNRFIVNAILKAIAAAKACPLCGRTEDHVH